MEGHITVKEMFFRGLRHELNALEHHFTNDKISARALWLMIDDYRCNCVSYTQDKLYELSLIEDKINAKSAVVDGTN